MYLNPKSKISYITTNQSCIWWQHSFSVFSTFCTSTNIPVKLFGKRTSFEIPVDWTEISNNVAFPATFSELQSNTHLCVEDEERGSVCSPHQESSLGWQCCTSIDTEQWVIIVSVEQEVCYGQDAQEKIKQTWKQSLHLKTCNLQYITFLFLGWEKLEYHATWAIY